jgi:hypothetical protein
VHERRARSRPEIEGLNKKFKMKAVYGEVTDRANGPINLNVELLDIQPVGLTVHAPPMVMDFFTCRMSLKGSTSSDSSRTTLLLLGSYSSSDHLQPDGNGCVLAPLTTERFDCKGL